MDERKFRESMDKWLSHEMKTAPEISPTEEVYQKLLGRKKRARFAFFTWPVRLAAAGLAAALIVLVIVLQPPRELEPIIGLRKGFVEEKEEKKVEEERTRDRMKQVSGEAVKEEAAVKLEKERQTGTKLKAGKETEAAGVEGAKVEPPERVVKMQAAKSKVMEEPEKPKEADREALVRPVEIAARPKVEEKLTEKDVQNETKLSQVAPGALAIQEQIIPERIEFQVQPKGSGSIKGLDIRTHGDEIITLSSEDNYRLFLQLPRERYVYIFQVSADQRLIRLFPNPAYHPEQNPLQPGKVYIVPMPPDWFYVEEVEEGEAVYVVTASQPKQEWGELYTEYESLDKNEEKKNIVSGILDEFKALEESPTENTAVYVFRFRSR
jgi:cytoskeletal protein RodZ